MQNKTAEINTLSYEEIQRLMVVKQLELNTLLEITQAINNNLSATSIVKMYEFILRFHLHIGKLVLYFNEGEKWTCKSFYGVNQTVKLVHPEEEFENYSEVSKLDPGSNDLLKGLETIIPVYHKNKPLAFVLIGGTEELADTYNDIVNFVRTITNIIVVALENKRMFNDRIDQEKLGKELEIAGKVQSMLIPSELPKNDRFEISATYLPHQTVGGDYYDFIKINEDEFIFCIADVSGKGMSAALLMSNFQASLRALVPQKFSLVDLVNNLNQNVLNNTKGDRFITFFISKYNVKTRELLYVNAGHNPPFLYMKNEIHELNQGCTILGIFEELPSIKFGSVKIEEDGLLVAYTDGLVEIQTPTGENNFEEPELQKFIEKNYMLPVDDFNEKLLRSIDDYRERKLLHDDLTIFCLRAF